MATQNQIEANRRNSLKSTGPRTPEGKAVSRFNALKTGIHAQSQVIPGENAADLEELTADYYDQFPPSSATERFLVDTLIASEWRLRRLRTAEAQLWQHELKDASDSIRGLQQECPLGHVFDRSTDNFTRMHNYLQSAERSYFRALKELNRLQAGAARPSPSAPDPEAAPPEPANLELASFFQNPETSPAASAPLDFTRRHPHVPPLPEHSIFIEDHPIRR